MQEKKAGGWREEDGGWKENDVGIIRSHVVPVPGGVSSQEYAGQLLYSILHPHPFFFLLSCIPY